MKVVQRKRQLLRRRHRRLRGKVTGTAERPRLCVYRSLRHIYAQLVDDEAGATLASVSTKSPELKGVAGGNVEAAKKVGELLAQKAREASIERVVFDRGGRRYHGRVKAVADAAREGGLRF